MAEERIAEELGSREREQPAPPHIVWDSLTRPRQRSARPWLDLLADEVEPRVLAAPGPAPTARSSGTCATGSTC